MGAFNNRVFKVAMQFCHNVVKVPETVIYGYAKLLSMDEKQVSLFVADDCMADFEDAHKWFSDNKLDLKLIRSGLLLLIPYAGKEKKDKEIKEFQDYLDGKEPEDSSAEILEKALRAAFVPLKELFAEGRDLSDIYEYANELNKKHSTEEPEGPKEKKTDRPKTRSESSKADKDKVGRTTEKVSLMELGRKCSDLQMALLDEVKGQDHAVLKFIHGYIQGELLKNTEKNNRPKAYFFFFGPPGVGKTLLAETAAGSLGIPYKFFNMSEYADQQSHSRLLGVDSYFNKAEEGVLVKFVRENPECLLVFDEIEKAHINVIRQFLQILGSGSMTNVNRKEDVSFRDAIIIFTSNVGSALYEDRSVNLSTMPEKVLLSSIQSDKSLPPELCSRIAAGNMVIFNHLPLRQITQMVRDSFDRIVQGIKTEYGIKMTYSEDLPMLFTYSRGDGMDARIAVGQSGSFLKDEIYELIRQMENSKEAGKPIRTVNMDIELKETDDELVALFKNTGKTEVLIFSGNEMYDSLKIRNCIIHRASDYNEAKKFLMKDIAAAFIDPFFGKSEEDEAILSIADYNTVGVRLFHEIEETQASLPVFLLEEDTAFSEVDRRTFLQEGAYGTILVKSHQMPSFKRRLGQILEEIYLENGNRSFSQSGWVIGYSTKQEIKNGVAKILFYGLKKRKATDVESRGSILKDAEKPNVKFNDVIGADNAKEKLADAIEYLKNPKHYIAEGGKPIKGYLLYGPPGTGKTMLARALAGEADVSFLQTSATEFKAPYVGLSEANIRDIFKKAKKYAPAIIFIDEIDAIGKKRTGSEFTNHTESMLNSLLTELDGFASFDPLRPVFVLAATNYGVRSEQESFSSLDEALIRRFDDCIFVGLPNEEARKTYIDRMLEKKKMTGVSKETVQNIAERTTGKSLAILQNVIDLAFRKARKKAGGVADKDLLNALEEYIYGEKKEHSRDYYRKVACHEAGHAYVSYLSGDKPTYLTIEARGDFGGYMQHSNQEDVPEYTKEQLLSKIRISLAGRAAEQVFYGTEESLNTGASSDLKHATDMAFMILCTFGMDENRLVVLKRDEIMQSSMAGEYVKRVNDLLSAEMDNTLKIIKGGKKKIEKIVEALLKENRLNGKQLEKLMKEK